MTTHPTPQEALTLIAAQTADYETHAAHTILRTVNALAAAALATTSPSGHTRMDA